MIVARLYGGLGNQMFQYAAGRALSLRLNTELMIDLSWFKDNAHTAATARSFELDLFEFDATPIALRWRRDRLRYRARKLWPLREAHHQFDRRVMTAPDRTCLDGYWPSGLYFLDVAAQIRKDFEFKPLMTGANEVLAAQIDAVDAVSIHVRRGDYVSNKNASQLHGLAGGLGYYYAAVKQVEQRRSTPHFFVFSDDPQWCRENLVLDAPTTYVDHNHDQKSFEDMRLMSRCRHHIIANSSFSWWGAWLDPRRDKMVVGPQRWFRDASLDTSHVLPKTWIRL